MEKDWVCIYSTITLHLAEIARTLLAEQDIESVIVNKKDSNYLFGSIEVYVKNDHALTGKYVLRNLEENDNETLGT